MPYWTCPKCGTKYNYAVADDAPVCSCSFVPVIVGVDPVVASIRDAGESTKVKLSGRKFLRNVVDKERKDVENRNIGNGTAGTENA